MTRIAPRLMSSSFAVSILHFEYIHYEIPNFCAYFQFFNTSKRSHASLHPGPKRDHVKTSPLSEFLIVPNTRVMVLKMNKLADYTNGLQEKQTRAVPSLLLAIEKLKKSLLCQINTSVKSTHNSASWIK